MSTRLARNFFYLTVSNVLSPLFSMALVLAISRLQGVETLGKYSLLMTVFILGQACGTLGLSIVITREVAPARERAGHYFINATVLTGTLVAGFLVLAIPAVRWLVADREMQLAMALVLGTFLPSIVMTYGEAILLAFERAGDSVAVGMAENVVRACLGTALVAAGYGIVPIACAILGVRLLASVGMLVVLRRVGVSLRERLDGTLWRELWGHIPVVGAIPIVNQIYARADMFLLSYFGSWTDIGLYSAGLRLVDLARTLPPAYGKAVYPILSRLHGASAEEFGEMARRSVRQSVLLVAPLAFVLAAFSGVLISTIYGAKAAGAERTLAVLAWTLLPLGAACALAQILFAAGRQAVDLRVNVIATVVSVGTNLALIPRFGAMGAAVSMLVSMTIYAALQYFWVTQQVVRLGAAEHCFKIVIVAVLGVLGVRALERVSPVLGAAFGVAIFLGGVLATGLVTREDLVRVRRVALARIG